MSDHYFCHKLLLNWFEASAIEQERTRPATVEAFSFAEALGNVFDLQRALAE
jgi:hypothetical protein